MLVSHQGEAGTDSASTLATFRMKVEHLFTRAHVADAQRTMNKNVYHLAYLVSAAPSVIHPGWAWASYRREG